MANRVCHGHINHFGNVVVVGLYPRGWSWMMGAADRNRFGPTPAVALNIRAMLSADWALRRHHGARCVGAYAVRR